MKLNEFLVKAKVNTYATGGESKEKILQDGSKEFTFKEGEFEYQDRYLGYNPFIGEEIVWQNKKIVWGMNYYGKVISETTPTRKVYGFLKEALKKVTAELPFRGPKEFSKDNFKYINEIKGNLTSFSGTEKILHNGKEVYFLHYHGGLIN